MVRWCDGVYIDCAVENLMGALNEAQEDVGEQ